jgi:hypothetical protein
MKGGRFSKYEIKYITDNAEYMSYVDIARELNREPETVRTYIEQKLGLSINLVRGAQKAAPTLRSKSFWPLIRQQFSTEEQLYIEDAWNKIYKQFNDNVTATEEIQIIDMIKLDVLMHRFLIKKEKEKREQEELRSNIHKLSLRDAEENKFGPKIAMMKAELAILVQAENNGVRDYKDLQAAKDKILKDMKSTRDQRYERSEASSQSMKTWMAELIHDDNKREILGKHLEKIRLASLDEEIRLAAWHKYEDGKIDQPFLTPSTVKDGHEIT